MAELIECFSVVSTKTLLEKNFLWFPRMQKSQAVLISINFLPHLAHFLPPDLCKFCQSDLKFPEKMCTVEWRKQFFRIFSHCFQQKIPSRYILQKYVLKIFQKFSEKQVLSWKFLEYFMTAFLQKQLLLYFLW